MKTFTVALVLLASLLGVSAHAAGFTNAGVQVQEYIYDFAVDGGTAASNIVLSAKAGASSIPANAVVLDVVAYVITSVTSASNASVEWGNAGDTDGYSGAAIAKGTLVANYAHSSGKGAGALLWDDTNDVNKPYVPAASDLTFIMKINEHNLTAGKIAFDVLYLAPQQ